MCNFASVLVQSYPSPLNHHPLQYGYKGFLKSSKDIHLENGKAVFAETLENLQHLTLLILRSQSYTCV